MRWLGSGRDATPACVVPAGVEGWLAGAVDRPSADVPLLALDATPLEGIHREAANHRVSSSRPDGQE